MKNTFLMLMAFVSISLIFNSCRQDGDWDNVGADRYSFTIERDKDFIEKGVGEKNQLTYNINPSYKFEAFEMKFKYTSTLNGILSLNGVVLEQNKEYTLTKQNNIFEYVGNVSGTHNVKIITTNSKGYTKTEDFELKYGVSEFTHTFQGGTGDIYQGEASYYTMKIVPGQGQPTTGYKIKFVSYTGEIKMNDIAVQTGQEYDLPNIDNFKITLTTSQVGQGVLHYTLKNATVSKDFSTLQDIKKRQILVESMNINSTSVAPNTNMSLIGVIKKSPIAPNNTIQYKTWISASSNNNTSGIQNTNNAYVPYTLGATGNFTYNMNASATGTYTYNIQFKDEFGNESDVKSFNIEVGIPLTFIGQQSASLLVTRSNSGGQYGYILTGFNKSFKVEANPAKIISVEYTADFYFNATPMNKSVTENINLQSTVEYNNIFHVAGQGLGYVWSNPNAVNNASLKVTVNANDGTSIEKIIPATIIYQ